jgi:hypothetical protein
MPTMLQLPQTVSESPMRGEGHIKLTEPRQPKRQLKPTLLLLLLLLLLLCCSAQLPRLTCQLLLPPLLPLLLLLLLSLPLLPVLPPSPLLKPSRCSASCTDIFAAMYKGSRCKSCHSF